MLKIDIPGYKTIQLKHLVLDYNGTLALDGEIIDGVKDRLARLSRDMGIHVLTADTFGQARSRLKDVKCLFHLIGKGDQALAKAEYVKGIGPESVVSMGNGRNDRLMLEISALGIGLIQEEGGSVSTLLSADVICRDILDALDLLLFPLRLMATLRS
jgi:soluble P-type ATPase